MSLHAIDNIDDAIDATQAFLFPFDLRTWLKLAFVAFFVAGGGGALNLVRSMNSFNNFDQGASPTGPTGTGSEFALTGTLDVFPSLVGGTVSQVTQPGPDLPSGGAEALAGLGVLVIVAIVAIVLFALVVGVLSNFMEFVFVQSLAEQEVHVRRYFGDNVGNGVQLLAFRFVFGLLAGAASVGLFLLFFLVAAGGEMADLGPQLLAASSTLLIVGFLGFALVTGTINGFTTVFVVPLMLQGDHGIITGWQRLFSSLREQPKQYLAYLFFSVVLGIGVNIVSGFALLIGGGLLAIPFGLVAVALWFALGEGLAAGILAGIVVVLFVLTLFVVAMLVKVPLVSFLRYYAMLVLGDIDADMDPIPDVRADVEG
ncbi:hypothetical protein NDI85_16485 [Halomicroarcula sp. S1AR25-4]|uniref:DUF7544 domain-containing protein n=1 Tax=Haloarcula sp. S1AR25-4 TaxID=2950538 RepID=UPI002874E896|nr:hypothetical protein [Halomicroarcula sp. S1AR25-4]MDS0279396.1 hypothetical protein [Halomicroarcula sp. S1AR25-4]